MKYLFIILLLFFYPSFASAKCDFKTSAKIEGLKNPSDILNIRIDIPKSGKFFRNAFKILTSASQTPHIPADLKQETFKANIVVTYSFGTCSYKAKIKQNGDFRDHIKLLQGGHVLRSLNIKLIDGNILNAVKFKLLIPQTRNGSSEVLGSLIMKKLGFISPETFEVDASINGVQSKMLFQEGIRKELLEKNNRREGPIFEGDETIIYSSLYPDANNNLKAIVNPKNEHWALALANLSNDNWFIKGKSSENIALRAFGRLQAAYLPNASFYNLTNRMIIKLNHKDNFDFDDYLFSLFSMNASHGAFLNNRRFYFNTFTDSFEPIYNDGNIDFQKKIIVQDGEIIVPKDGDNINTAIALDVAFKNTYDATLIINKIKQLPKNKFLFSDFIKRTKLDTQKSKQFFDKALMSLIDNSSLLEKALKKSSYTNEVIEKEINNHFDNYKDLQLKNKMPQKLIVSLMKNTNGYLARYSNNEVVSLKAGDVAKIISKNLLNDRRHVLLNVFNSSSSLMSKNRKFPVFPGKVFASDGIAVDFDSENKIINFKQTDSKDWVFISEADLKDWSLNFGGLKVKETARVKNKQRFNSFGLTGCLNFYNVSFDNTSIVGSGGHCEDNVNIVMSTGKLANIKVSNAYSDAVDLDFSDLVVNKMDIHVATNDCLDLSGGNYKINIFSGFRCGDKGISIGENSNLIVTKSLVDTALIGVSSKDLSSVFLNHANFLNV
ncbi:hypothetical protein OAU79_00260, partial [bacterium]|nr:hypothetical protein [bacterium]